jgi:exopolysaccharide production protein ExoZ
MKGFSVTEDRKTHETIDGIQVLRAVAAIMVVIEHSRYAVPGGEAAFSHFFASGVDIFFVISGFVMALTTGASDQNISFWDGRSEALLFLRKRVARIVPLYWLATLWTTRRELPDLNLAKDFLFIPRWNPAFPDSILPSVVQGWTLNYEMFFYALFSASMLFRAKRSLVLISALVAISLLAFVPGEGIYQRFYTNNIILEFGIGVVLFQLIKFTAYPQWRRSVFVVLMLVGFALLMIGYSHAPRFLTQGLPSALIVWASFGACKGWLQVGLLKKLGDASYAIYLFHWASFGALKPLVALAPDRLYPLLLVHIIFAIFSGIAIHLVVETRLINATKILLRLDRRTVAPASNSR